RIPPTTTSSSSSRSPTSSPMSATRRSESDTVTNPIASIPVAGAPAAPPTVVDGLAFPFPDYPAPGMVTEVADGIFWISTPVPFVGLKQVNLWLLRDGDGWTQIDCGYGR